MPEDAIAAVPPEVIGTGVIMGTPEQVTARATRVRWRGAATCRARASLGLHRGAGRGLRRAGGPKDRSLTADGIVRAQASHQLGRRKAAVPTGVYDNWGSPVEVTTWKRLGE